VNSAPPAIVGTPKVDGPLSSTPGTWSDAGSIAYGYAWEECDAQGGSCMPLSYSTQSIDALHAVAGQTVRVVVTATASDGSATVASAPKVVQGAGSGGNGGGGGGTSPSGLKLTLVSPKTVVHSARFTISIRLQGATQPVRLTVGSPQAGGTTSAQRGSNGVYRFAERVTNGGRYLFGARATSGSKSGRLDFAVTAEPPVTGVQDPGGQLTAPGCSVCVVRDPRGDNKGAAPDLASATSNVANGWVTLTVTAYDAVRNAAAGAGHPCIVGWPLGTSGRRTQMSMGCFTGPHAGKIFGGCPRPDGAGDCGPVQMSYPDVHTIRYRFRAVQLGNPPALAWQAWILYPGDQLKDTIPSVAHLGNDPAPNCEIIQQLRRQGAGAYRFGRGRCPQAGVTARR
jgi:hypothetical protein